MNKNILLVLGLVLAMCMPQLASAQQHVVKVRPFNLFFGNIAPSYEYVINEKQSAHLTAGFTLPQTFDGSIPIILDGNTNEFTYSDATLSGFSITPEYRFYLLKEAPRGLYIAPYLRYNSLGLSLNEQIENFNTEISLRYSVITPGAQLGVQWLIADRVSIDWNIVGIGFGLYNLGVRIEAQDGTGDINNWQNEIDEAFTDILLFDDIIEFSADGTRVDVSAPVTGLTFRSNLSIGVAF